LILRENLDIEPLAVGGGQEMGRRSGTENVVGIAGFGAAAKAAMTDLEQGAWDRVAEIRDSLAHRLVNGAPDAILIGQDKPRLPNTICLAVPGWKGETQVMQMDLAGFAVSAGSACSSGKVKSSRVLKAMGYDDMTAASAVRVSIGPQTTKAEASAFADAWLRQYEKYRARAA
jgi:cysteine desulfurase